MSEKPKKVQVAVRTDQMRDIISTLESGKPVDVVLHGGGKVITMNMQGKPS